MKILKKDFRFGPLMYSYSTLLECGVLTLIVPSADRRGSFRLYGALALKDDEKNTREIKTSSSLSVDPESGAVNGEAEISLGKRGCLFGGFGTFKSEGSLHGIL